MAGGALNLSVRAAELESRPRFVVELFGELGKGFRVMAACASRHAVDLFGKGGLVKGGLVNVLVARFAAPSRSPGKSSAFRVGFFQRGVTGGAVRFGVRPVEFEFGP